MQSQASHDVYQITFSKWKVWSFTIALWTMSCLFLFPAVILIEGLLTGKTNIESSIIIGLAFFSLIFLFVAGVPFWLLTKLNKPLTTLNQKRQDILEAINRLSPYPVEYIGMWRAAMV